MRGNGNEIYLLARKFQGNINLSSMRYFENRESIKEYVDHLCPGQPQEWFVYKIWDWKENRDAKPLPTIDMQAIGLRSKEAVDD